MIEALISGKLQGQPEQRTSKSGKTYVTAKLRVAAGAEETHFVRITAFSDSACTALLALGDGDAVSVAGALKVGVWTPQGGEPRANLDMVASQVLSVYHLERRRKAMQPGEADERKSALVSRSVQRRVATQQRAADPAPDDFGVESDDAWLAGGAP